MNWSKLINLIIVISTFCYACIAWPHNPIDITIDISSGSDELPISVHHPVDNPNKHYIRKIEVILDDQPIIKRYFFFQKGGFERVSFTIPGLREGKKIEVKAYSTGGGVLERKFDLQQLREEKGIK